MTDWPFRPREPEPPPEQWWGKPEIQGTIQDVDDDGELHRLLDVLFPRRKAAVKPEKPAQRPQGEPQGVQPGGWDVLLGPSP